MQAGDSNQVYSRAGVAQRVAGLLDRGAATERCGRVLVARGKLEGTAVSVIANDPSSAGGAIGTGEADRIGAALRAARDDRLPVLWLLDSAGADVRQGLHALGAFRRLFRAGLEVRAAGVPTLALLGRSCFGGASMIACLCDARSYLPQTRLATSGPAVIEGACGRAEFDAGDEHAVGDLMGSARRLVAHPEDALREDTLPAARAAASAWLRGSTAHAPCPVHDRHAQLRARLEAAGIGTGLAAADSWHPGELSGLLPPACRPSLHGRLLRALPPQHSGRALFLGAVGGEPVGAQQCWLLADWLLQVPASHPASPVVLVLDADGHAASVIDERLLLSDYLVHLGSAIAALSASGHRMVLWVVGHASGASYVAFAAGAERVCALPGARLAVLPGRAVERIVGPGAGTPTQDWFESGVADALLDAQQIRADAPA
jgi:hypothetical protein